MSNIKISEIATEELENLDFDSMSDEEIQDIIHQLENEATIYDTLQMAEKICLNSIYGALANKHFYFFDLRLAETITLQGQDAIKFSEKILNEYFWKAFHKDTAVLKELKKKCPDVKLSFDKCEKPVVIYMDTDSCYVTFEEPMKACNWTGHVNDFVLTLNELRLEKYLNKQFDSYANYYNTDNFLQFELESIAYNGIWVAKKKYVQNMSWSDGKVYDYLQKTKAKGLEIVQSSTPTYCRSILVELVNWIFREGKHFKIKDLATTLLDIKKKFMISDIEDISKNTSIGNYEKYIIDDKQHVEFAPKCPPHIQGAGVHNHLLYKNSELRNTYDVLRSKDKVRWYYTTHPKYDKFSYARGSYPAEFAPSINYDLQYETTLLGPLNNIISSMGHAPLTANLNTMKKLF